VDPQPAGAGAEQDCKDKEGETTAWTSHCIDLSECILDSARRVLDRHVAKLREREDREMWLAMRLRRFVSTRSLASRVCVCVCVCVRV
jgi:hypothetical protein